MLSTLSVRRPVFAAVAAIILCVIGLAAFFALPVRELPNVDPPLVSVSTSYNGASAEVIEQRITQTIERQVSGIQGIDRVTSTSRDGRSNVSIQFLLSRNLDDAANDVRDAVSRVTRQLPQEADPPTIAKADADSQPIIILDLESATMERRELADYATRYLIERLAVIPGVAQVNLQGAQQYAMRIWIDPSALAARGLTVDDVQTALSSENVELPAGTLEGEATDFTVRVNRNYATPEQFANLPISATGTGTISTGGALGTSAYVTRLGDIARVEEGVDEWRRIYKTGGGDRIGLSLTRQSQANDMQISKNVEEAIVSINEGLPKGTKISLAIDNTKFTAESIAEVWITMAISLALVALVNFIFLGSLRAAIVPTVVAPICVLSSFIIMAPLGFSLNLLTLLALVLSIGLVVDDAIVVVENIQRRIDEGEPPPVAAERGAKEVFFAVVATTIVLISVFAPLMFMPGFTGRLFVELAVAIAGAVFFSAILALSLSPMLSSKLLRPAHSEGWLARRVNVGMESLRGSYERSLQFILSWKLAPIVVGAVVVVLAGAAVGLFVYLPKEVVPPEDRGVVNMQFSGPEGAGFEYTAAAGAKIEPIIKKLQDEHIVERYSMTIPGFGGGSFNSGSVNMRLVPFHDRTMSSDDVAARINREVGSVTGVRANASVQSGFARGGGGGGGGGGLSMIAAGDEYTTIYRWLQPILTAAEANPGLVRPRIQYEPTSPRVLIDIDREKAAALGVSARTVGGALQTMLGSLRATTYIKRGQEYDVILQTERAERRTEGDIANLYVRARTGELIPLSSVTKTQVIGDAPDRRRVDRMRAINLSTSVAPGYTTGEAIDFLKAEAAKQPGNIVVQWDGAARDYLESSNSIGIAFGFALLMVFLVLAAQFESWIHPAIIMLTVPLAALGGLFGLLMAGSTVNTYSQIGLIILIGVAAKNGILIVEFSNQLRDRGLEVKEAVIEAAGLRLRPIIMTSISAAFGALPLMLWQGPGAGSRQTIGVTIFCGSIFATMLTLFVVPVFYNLLARFTKSPEWMARLIEAYDKDAPAGEGHGAPAPAE
ncbi:MAG: efflux RND transporter permease subunit [Caulobacterales bacterium]|nr:efflux RND transporter permease subunit [Caulobacterales bacterium]